MSEDNTIFDENQTERPLGLSSEDKDIKLSRDAKSLIKDNPRDNKVKKDDTQHMKKMRNKLLLLAGTTSYINYRHQKTYNKAVKAVECGEAEMKSLTTKPGAMNSYGRSIAEVFAEDELKRKKKNLEKLQKKWPNLQRPNSLKDGASKATKTIFSGVNQALRSQTMKGVAQANSGSDTRAIAAANMAGYVPGTSTESEFGL